MSIVQRTLAMMVALGLMLTLFAGTAKADDTNPGALAKNTQLHAVDANDLAELENDLRTVFEVYLKMTDKGWAVNDADAAQAAGVSRAELAQIAASLNSLQPRAQANVSDVAQRPGITPQHQIGTKAWGLCVLNYVFPGAAGGLVHDGIIAWLQKGKYAQVASYLLRVVGPAALRGGGVGLVAFLAAGVAWCSTPWAK